MLVDPVIRRMRFGLGLPPRLIKRKFAGHNVTVREGLIHTKPDKDDGWMAALILDSSIFLDVGCNVGLWSLYAALTGPNRTIVAWDANPAALAACAENLFWNSVSHRARFVLGFASSKRGEELEFFTVGTGAAGSRYQGHARTASRKGLFSHTKTETIDHVLSAFNLTPDLVKIDVEGAEADALEGAKELVRHNSPRVIVEMHSPPELPMIENCRRVLAWCREVGYRAYYLKEHAQITTPALTAHRGRCHLLLIPEQAEFPPWLKAIHQDTSVEAGMSAYQTK